MWNFSCVPNIFSRTMVTISPFSYVSTPFSNSPRRTSGPFVSSRIAIFFPVSLTTSRMFLIRFPCSSKSPWEKFKRMMFIPFSTSFVIISLLSEAGPIVQIILVFLFASMLISFPNYLIKTARSNLLYQSVE